MGRPRKSLPISSHNPQPPQQNDPLPLQAIATNAPEQRALCRIRRVQRTRSGCTTCKQRFAPSAVAAARPRADRARRKKCDEVLPICGDCRRLGLPCDRASTHSPDAAVAPGFEVAVRRSAACAQWRAPSPERAFRPYDGCTAQEAHLLQHYTCAVARSLSVVPDELNPFLTLFVPMALQQPALRNALLALSATHLKRTHPGVELAAAELHGRALRQANQRLARGDGADGLAAVLFLCLLEVCEGRSRKWQIHLAAAVNIINDRGGPGAYPPSVLFLIEGTRAPHPPPPAAANFRPQQSRTLTPRRPSAAATPPRSTSSSTSRRTRARPRPCTRSSAPRTRSSASSATSRNWARTRASATRPRAPTRASS